MSRIVILGATSAIAQAAARIFAARGDSLFLVARDAAKLEMAQKDIAVRAGKEPGHCQADLSLTDSHEGVLNNAFEFLGEPDVYLIAYGSLGDQQECERDWAATEKELRTNFLSPVSLLNRIASRLEKRGSGVIAVITSVAGDRGRQSNYIYGAAKGGLSLYLQGMRNRLHRAGVRVLTIKPGFVDTPMTAQIKKSLLFASPETVAHGIVRALDRKKDVVYLPWWWRPILLLVKLVPESIFKRLRL